MTTTCCQAIQLEKSVFNPRTKIQHSTEEIPNQSIRRAALVVVVVVPGRRRAPEMPSAQREFGCRPPQRPGPVRDPGPVAAAAARAAVRTRHPQRPPTLFPSRGSRRHCHIH